MQHKPPDRCLSTIPLASIISELRIKKGKEILFMLDVLSPPSNLFVGFTDFRKVSFYKHLSLGI